MTLPSKIIFHLGLIVNEILTNIFKYAFPAKNGHVDFSLQRKNNDLILIIQDNGIGLPDRFNENYDRGFGHVLVSILIKQIHGTFSLENSNGLKVIVQFPIQTIIRPH